MRSISLAGIVCALVFASVFTASAEEPKKSPKVEPSLTPDPKVVKILDELGDNSSAILTDLKTVGEWNAVTKEYGLEKTGPMGRDFTNKAVWMPDRKRAFFCGANHGAPHRLNDAWEFDLPSHTWVMLFAPDANNAKGVMEIKEFEVDGTKVKYIQTKRGGPTHFGHTWWAFTYDPSMKAALWMNVHIGTTPARYIEMETGSKEGVYAGPPMWAFLPWEKKWQMVFSPPPYPRVPYAAQMEYVPDLKGLYWSQETGAATAPGFTTARKTPGRNSTKRPTSRSMKASWPTTGRIRCWSNLLACPGKVLLAERTMHEVLKQPGRKRRKLHTIPRAPCCALPPRKRRISCCDPCASS